MDISTAETAPDITLTSPADLVDAVPYLLGYHPDNRLVIIGLSDGIVAVTACLDLIPIQNEPSEETLPVAAFRSNELSSVIILGYGAAQQVTRCVDYLRSYFDQHDVHVMDAIRVNDGRFWSYLCHRPSCCPPEGTLVKRSSNIAAEFTLGGAQVLPDRESVLRQLDPVSQEMLADIAERSEKYRAQLSGQHSVSAFILSEGCLLLATLAGSERLPDPELVARIAVLLTDRQVMNEAIMLIEAESDTAMVDLWLWVTRHLTGTALATPAALLSFAAWRRGNGLLATEAVTRSLEANPTLPLAQFMDKVLRNGVSPSKLPKLTRDGKYLFDDCHQFLSDEQDIKAMV